MKRIFQTAIAGFFALSWVLGDASSVLAVSEVERFCVGRHCPNWSNEKGACANIGSGSVGTLPSSVPAPYNAIFTDAAANGPHKDGKSKGAADPMMVAIIFYVEHRGFPDPPKPYGNGGGWATSPAGAKGPFQFLDGTWKEHGRDLDGKNGADVMDLKEAAYGAADFIFDIGGKAGIPLGNPDKPRQTEPSVVDVLASYNGGSAYATDGSGSPISAETRQYIQIGVKIYNKLKGGSADAGSTTALGCDGGGGGSGVSPDGFVFPLKTTKPKMTNNAYWSPKCKNPVPSMGRLGGLAQRKDLCHHDYLAADIQTPAGTPVLAPRPGRVIRTSIASVAATCFGSSVTIYSDKALGGDGNTYYETHLAMSHTVREGQKVTAGQQVSTIGASGSCFQPHLHIDVSPVQEGFARNSSGTQGPLLDPQPALVAAYQNLPEN